ncbi:MAG: hypothetical protein MMC33_006364 [Icmadophila ericetorum]|nr:hypothetical protein [Icmadophila ericetorum]
MNKSLLPSAGWKSWQAYEGLNFPSMNERLQDFMVSMNKSALIKHAEITTGRTLSLSKPFSAGFNWCCFELIANDGTFFIARVKLPRHPDDDDTVDEDSVSYMRKCEIATMNFLQERVEAVSVPQIYGWAMPGSQNAQEVGAACMLIEGFQGNVLFDGHSKVYDLPISAQEHISAQWTSFQAGLATVTFTQTGSISNFSKDTGPIIGKIGAAVGEGFSTGGPFGKAKEYFKVLAEARYRDCVIRLSSKMSAHSLSVTWTWEHNIIVDDDFNFLAVIDWELAQAVPWEANHYPMPFPLIQTDTTVNKIMQDSTHLAQEDTTSQGVARKLYRQKFRNAEQALAISGRPLGKSIAGLLDGYAMVQLAYGLESKEARRYLRKLETHMNTNND